MTDFTKQIEALEIIHSNMIQRCCNPKDPSYPFYGGRRPKPVTIYKRWLNVSNFVRDILRLIGPRPEGVGPKGLSLHHLDRIDNDKNYEPGNLRWALVRDSVRNKRPPRTKQQLAEYRAMVVNSSSSSVSSSSTVM